MKPKAKKVMTVGFALTAVGIWIPQIFMGVVEPRPEDRLELGNGDLVFEDAMGDESPMPPPAGAGELASAKKDRVLGTGAPTSNAGSSAPAASERGSSVGDSLASILQRMDLVDSTPARVNLSDLMSALRPESKASNSLGDAQTTGAAQTSMGLGSTLAAEARLQRVLNEYCESQSLLAVIFKQDGGVAMLGSRPVRIGETLESGIQVVGIDKRGVRLALGSLEQRILLPSFKAKRAKTDGPDEVNSLDASFIRESSPSPVDVALDTGAPDSEGN